MNDSPCGRERTLALAKPDAVEMEIENDIIHRYVKAGLSVAAEKRVRLTKEEAQMFYREHAGKPYFPGLYLAMSSGISHAVILEGENAVAKVRELNGPTRDAPAGTVRGDFKSAGGPFNIVHGSDSLAAADREIAIVFGRERGIL